MVSIDGDMVWPWHNQWHAQLEDTPFEGSFAAGDLWILEAAEGAQLALLSLSRSSGTRAYHNNIVLHSLWAITCVHTCATEALNKSPFPCVQCSH